MKLPTPEPSKIEKGLRFTEGLPCTRNRSSVDMASSSPHCSIILIVQGRRNLEGLTEFAQDHRLRMQQRSIRCGSEVMNPTSIHEEVGSIPGPPQWVKDLTLS